MCEPTQNASDAQSAIYEIRIRGRLESEHWTRCFEGMTMSFDQNGNSILHGPIKDQAALYGLLARLRDLALPPLSLMRDNHSREHDTTIEEDEEMYSGVY